MKKNIFNFFTTLILALLLSLILPWWSVMIAAFMTSFPLSLKKSAVFFVPFLAISLFWIVYAFELSNANDFILAKKIAVLFPFNGNAYLLILATGVIGGVAAGVSALFGNQCRIIFGIGENKDH